MVNEVSTLLIVTHISTLKKSEILRFRKNIYLYDKAVSLANAKSCLAVALIEVCSPVHLPSISCRP